MSAINKNNNKSSQQGSNLGRNVAFGVAALAGGSILAMAPFVLMYAKSSLPYMATPRRKVVEALVFMENELPNKIGKWHFTDLGSGDGEAVLAASKRGWNAKGIEMNPTLWTISMVRRMFQWSNARFICGDMFSHRIPPSNDAVMIFGIQPLMSRVEQKLATEARVGSYVMAYRFELPLRRLDAKVVYHKEDMRIYQIRQNTKVTHDNT